MKKIMLFSICCLFFITGCVTNSKIVEEGEVKVSDIKVIINEQSYILKVENNKTSEEFINLLPQEFTMNELNDNEKYVYMNNSLTTNSYNPKHIEKGDVMLFGDNCLVIFYKSFDTSYSYTKIGHIDDLPDLGSGSVIVSFNK